jgi:hypothetical protein
MSSFNELDNEPNGWGRILPSYWNLSRTFWYLHIQDIQSLRAVNRGLKGAIDSFVGSMQGSFQAIIGRKAFCNIASFLTMDDLGSLNFVNMGCRFSVREYSASFPRDVRTLVSSWCRKEKPAMMMFSFECYQVLRPDFVLYHPPFLQVSLGPLAFDSCKKRLTGQPLSEVQINNAPPQNLGRREPFVCVADDDRSQIFYCGGKSFVYGQSDQPWLWISPMHKSNDCSTTCGLFCTKTGMWRELEEMPEPRAGGAACKVGERIFVFGGIKQELSWFEQQPLETMLIDRPPFTLVFDLNEERWTSNHCISNPGKECGMPCAAVAMDESNVVVVLRNQEVLSLNLMDGKWFQLPNLPVLVGPVLCCHVIEREGLKNLLAVGKNSWATICLSTSWEGVCSRGEWIMSPDLRGLGLPHVLLFYGNSVRVFSGNSWTWVDCVKFSTTMLYNGFIRGDSNAVGFIGYSLK